MFCTNCGKEIADKAVICVNCGCATSNSTINVGDKSFVVALLLCLFLGLIGAHRLYTGHIGSGILQLVLSLTVVGMAITGIWILIDLLCIICGSFRTKSGEQLAR